MLRTRAQLFRLRQLPPCDALDRLGELLVLLRQVRPLAPSRSQPILSSEVRDYANENGQTQSKAYLELNVVQAFHDYAVMVVQEQL
jgi:hypothetical protein